MAIYSSEQHRLANQINLIKHEMQKANVLSAQTPAWIQNFDDGPIEDIWQWMQFIYLPLRLTHSLHNVGYLAPKIRGHILGNPALLPILQMAIELDAITPTYHNLNSETI